MRRPPDCVVLVARTHWLVGAVIVVSGVVLHGFTRGLPAVEFGARTYVVVASLAGVYLLGGTLVWFGAPLGRALSRVCGLLYLPRPFGSHLWTIMNSPEFRGHFARGKSAAASDAERF